MCDIIEHRRKSKTAAQQAVAQEYLTRVKTEKLLFLALLQTMVKVCEELKPMPWVHKYGGWNPGLTVRAFNPATTPTEPIYEIHRQTTPNYYNIKVCQNTPEFGTIYDSLNLFVPNHLVPYLDAVFDLTACRNMSSTQRAKKLTQLKNMKIKKSQYWDEYPMARTIQYLQNLLPKQSK